MEWGAELGSKDFKLQYCRAGTATERPISPWRDIPLMNIQTSGVFTEHDVSKPDDTDLILNAVIEIPKWTRYKMEVDVEDEANHHPIVHDI